MFFSLIIQSIGICIIPSFDKVGWFLAGRLMIKVGGISWNCPLIPDYIMEESHVLANSYLMMCISLANVLSSYFIRVKFKVEYIYYGTGALPIVLGILVFFYLKDAIKEINPTAEIGISKIW